MIALGGNALSPKSEAGTINQQFKHTKNSLKGMMHFVQAGYNIWPPGILKLLNVKYIILPEVFGEINHPDYEIVKSGFLYYFGPYEKSDGKDIKTSIYRYKNNSPRLFYTKQIDYLDNEDKIYSNLFQDDFDPIKLSYLFIY